MYDTLLDDFEDDGQPQATSQDEPGRAASSSDDDVCFMCGQPEAAYLSTSEAVGAPPKPVCGKQCEAAYLKSRKYYAL